MAYVRNPVVYVPDLTNGRPIVDGKVYLLTSGTIPPMHDSTIDPADLLTVTYINEAGNTVEQPQPLYTSKGGCLYGNFPDAARQFMIAPQAYVFAAYNHIGELQYSAETSAGDYVETDALAAVGSTVLVGGKEAKNLGNINGNDNKRHFSIGAIPKCNASGVFELINDSVHNPLNVSSVTQPDQYTIRINYAKTATKINSFIAAPDAELAPYGVVCGGDVGTSFANIQAYAPLNFIADNNSPNPSIVLNDLWQPSIGVASITATRFNASTLRVTHPVSAQLEPPVVSTVNSASLFDYIVSYGSTQIDIICVGGAGGYLSYSGSAWSQAFSPNMTAPTLTWTGSNTLKIDHGTAYSGAVVPKLTPHGGTYIPVVVNYGSTFIEVAFYDYAGVKATTQNSNMTFWYELSLKVPCNWPAGAIVSVHRGLVHVPSYNFKGVVGNNLWVNGDFEY